MRHFAMALLFIAAMIVGRPTSSSEPDGSPITGDARDTVVFDGDSFDFGGRHFQLAGIDAPELGQRCEKEDGPNVACGLTAAYELRKRLQLDPRPLRCWPQSETQDGTILAVCAAGEDDLALVLVESGYARALPGAQIDYRLAEEKARGSGIGLWASKKNLAPWAWRAERADANANTPEDGCVIAGVVESAGRGADARLYFGPLDHQYAAKSVDAARGGRWFCSDEAAREAGFRRPGEGASR
ncbi:MAG: thermonuclease family protein [Rhodospirillales bacterium]|nr:thermonuclease family protein [Rhodospirillales bacterium]